MDISHKDDIRQPERTAHGEVIYPLLGAHPGAAAQKHSLAYVVIPPGKASQLHYHRQAEESYYVLQGRGRLTLEQEAATVEPGQAILIPAGQRHQISNVGRQDLQLLVVSVPPWQADDMVVVE